MDIDGALFFNGEFAFVGPDTALKFVKLETGVRAGRDLITELNRKLDDGEDVFAHIDRYASLTKLQAQAPTTDARSIIPNLERHYARSKKATAMSVVMRWQKFGEPATVEWIRASAKNQIPFVRK